MAPADREALLHSRRGGSGSAKDGGSSAGASIGKVTPADDDDAGHVQHLWGVLVHLRSGEGALFHLASGTPVVGTAVAGWMPVHRMARNRTIAENDAEAARDDGVG